jgi:FixJ family two-component response regulator
MIYIIEDDNQVRKALELLMQSQRYENRSFKSGEDFLQDTTAKNVEDILILDMNMSGVYGRDFLKQLIAAKNPVTVIGITAQDESGIRAYCREYGVKALLTKPVDSNALMDLIKYHSEMHGV